MLSFCISISSTSLLHFHKPRFGICVPYHLFLLYFIRGRRLQINIRVVRLCSAVLELVQVYTRAEGAEDGIMVFFFVVWVLIVVLLPFAGPGIARWAVLQVLVLMGEVDPLLFPLTVIVVVSVGL